LPHKFYIRLQSISAGVMEFCSVGNWKYVYVWNTFGIPVLKISDLLL